MDITLVLMAFLIQGLQEAEAFAVIGVEGQSLNITCVHSNAWSNVKYFCRRSCGDGDVLVRSKAPGTDDKYKIEDKGNTFFVIVSKLTQADKGDYWCGIDRLGVDTYNHVTIIVKTNDKGNGRSAGINTQTSKTLMYVGAGLGVVLVAMAIVLLIFFRRRKRATGSPQEKGKGVVLATLSKQKQDRHMDVAKEAITGECSAVDNVYSVPSQPENQPEAPFYSTVSFSEHADCKTVAASASSTTYSSIKGATDESTIYSSV